MGNSPTTITANLNIRSMGPISEREMSYSFDCYFRQYWNDKRLKFDHEDELTQLQLNNIMLRKIWKPDSHFLNGKKSHLHSVTSPNVLFRIEKNGNVRYSMRLTVKATCPMNLIKYPMDQQVCSLSIGSSAFISSHI
ncbi:hypothetical protein Ciccas_011182 [Cichlidogyrus casuarinus]|uniref:Neurotransmitter-gated ion-channel ligand-binding domain-containing protein n=1 Tax=Cichlidogyrus casuarinus TaxID=1844966 RepID=A0ABD2PUW2_9PLAT